MKQKWFFLLVATAAMLTACSSDDLSESPVQQPADDGAITFGAYVNRGVTRAGALGELTVDGTDQTPSASLKADGFGVFTYYTDSEPYSETSKPNFMYNQKVTYNGTAWTYAPLKYWPNEFGKNASSEGQDRLTFFAYAPYVNVNPSTGRILKGDGDPDNVTTSGIVGLTSNTTSGDPYVKYYADMDPDNRVDLCWAVAKDDFNASVDDEAINAIDAGAPYIDVLKPQTDSKINFDFKHALAALNVQIDADFDAESHSDASDIAPETRIWVRSVTFEGFTDKGRLNLNANIVDGPLWFDLSVADAPSGTVTIFDGRTDGKEGRENAIAKKESPATLNAKIIQSAPYDKAELANNVLKITNAIPGVTNTPVNLFDANGAADEDGDEEDVAAAKAAARLAMPIYVIPTDDNLKITIVYDVETYDPNLAAFLSDGAVRGSSVQNTIEKEITINDAAFKLEAGKIYTIGLHLGMTSVKFDASVLDWTNDATDVDLPYNRDGDFYTAEEAAAANLLLEGAWQYGEEIKTPGTDPVYYTEDEIAEHNAARDIWEYGRVKQAEVAAQNAVYSFTSYVTGEPDNVWSTGTVEVLEIDAVNNKTTVRVLTNPEYPEQEGAIYIVHATELADGLELYTAEDVATGISVKDLVCTQEAVAYHAEELYTDDEVNAHNALPEQEEWVAPRVKEEGTDPVYYTDEECDEHNAQLPGAVHEGEPKA